MIKNLEWVTKDGNKMKMKNSPIDMGVELLLISCSKDEKIKILNDLKSELEPKKDSPTRMDIGETKICKVCSYVYSAIFDECPECGSTECD